MLVTYLGKATVLYGPSGQAYNVRSQGTFEADDADAQHWIRDGLCQAVDEATLVTSGADDDSNLNDHPPEGDPPEGDPLNADTEPENEPDEPVSADLDNLLKWDVSIPAQELMETENIQPEEILPEGGKINISMVRDFVEQRANTGLADSD